MLEQLLIMKQLIDAKAAYLGAQYFLAWLNSAYKSP